MEWWVFQAGKIVSWSFIDFGTVRTADLHRGRPSNANPGPVSDRRARQKEIVQALQTQRADGCSDLNDDFGRSVLSAPS